MKFLRWYCMWQDELPFFHLHYLSFCTEYPIIESWKSCLPPEDIPWISKALFSFNAKGKPELDDRKIDRMWYDPPQAQLIPNQRPKPERYFGHRLFLWMPLRMFKIQLKCPICTKTELTKQGPYRNTRLVLDIDGFYILAGEYLHCSSCKKNQISWNQCILDQLDPSTRCKFPIHMLYKTACDARVMFMMHQRGLGETFIVQNLTGKTWFRSYSCSWIICLVL